MIHLQQSHLRRAHAFTFTLSAFMLFVGLVLMSGCFVRTGPGYGRGYNDGRGYRGDHYENHGRGRGGVVVVGDHGHGGRHEDRGTVRVR